MPDSAYQLERVFLDANVLFSAAIGSRTCRAIWDLPDLLLSTSDYCREEALRNLDAKGHRDGSAWLRGRLERVEITSTPPAALWEQVARHLPESAVSDRPVLAAAVVTGAQTLVTGNTRDFGALMAAPPGAAGLPDVYTPRGFLQRGPRRG